MPKRRESRFVRTRSKIKPEKNGCSSSALTFAFCDMFSVQHRLESLRIAECIKLRFIHKIA